MTDLEFYTDLVINSSKWINTILISGCVLVGVILLLKLFGKEKFELWGGINIKIVHTWLPITILTFGHLYASYVFIRSIDRVISEARSLTGSVWKSLTASESLFFNSMVERIDCEQKAIRVCQMDMSDPTALLSFVAVIGLFFSIFKLRKVGWVVRIVTFFAAILLCGTNWIIGSSWAIKASELTL